MRRRRSNEDDNRAPPARENSEASSSAGQPPLLSVTKKKLSKQTSDSRLSTSSSTSSSTGFQSFFRWFKRNEKEERKKAKTKSNSASQDGHHQEDGAVGGGVSQSGKCDLRGNRLSASSSSSCDSVFSTATNGFAFISPVNYNPHGAGEVAEIRINPGPETDTYRRRVEQQYREVKSSQHQANILSLKKKYGLYGTSETLQSETTFSIAAPPPPPRPEEQQDSPRPSPSSIATPSSVFSDLSLPTINHQHVQLRVPIDQRKQSSSQCDLIQNCSSNLTPHRRTWSECSIKKNKRSVHVRGKRPAPAPPGSLSSSLNRPGSSTYSSLARSTLKKRRAPPPPYTESPSGDSSGLPRVLALEPKFNEPPGGDLLNEINQAIWNHSTNPEMDHIRYFVNEPGAAAPAVARPSPTGQRMSGGGQGILAQKNSNQLKLDIPGQEQQEVGSFSPRLSPSSPRPWYKRPVSGSREPSSIPFKREVILRTVDKRRKKKASDDEKHSEFGFLRQSRFGLFSRNKESKKLDPEEVKRRSGIGMPNISELDREAKEILHNQRVTLTDEALIRRRVDLISDSEDEAANPSNQPRRRRKSARELISRFEAANSQNSRFTAPVATALNQAAAASEPPTPQIERLPPAAEAAKINVAVPPDVIKLGDSRADDNSVNRANFHVEDRGPKDKVRAAARGSLVEVWLCPYCTLENPNWRILCQVCERIKPYEGKSSGLILPLGISSANKVNSASAEKLKIDNENLDKKTDKVLKYFYPTANGGNNLSKSASETSVGGNLMTSKKFNKSNIGSPKLNGIRSVFYKHSNTDIANIAMPSEVVVNSVTVLHDSAPSAGERKRMNLNGTPDLEEVRHARLNHFKPPASKDTPAPIMITDKDSLDRERQRLKEKIRAMNAKATQKTPPTEDNYDTVYPKAENVPRGSPNRSAGAIKKYFKPPEEQPAAPRPPAESTAGGDSNAPAKEANRQSRPEKLTDHKREVRELTEQLKSTEGREEFKATLKFAEKTGTIAINKIMRSLETAIMDGEHELAANLAKDLAKMKVSLSVTRQKGPEPRSVWEEEGAKSIGIELIIEDQQTTKTPGVLRINPQMTVFNLKETIKRDFDYPILRQKLVYKDNPIDEDRQTLKECGIVDSRYPLRLFIVGVEAGQANLFPGRESSPKKMNAKYYLAEADQFNVPDSDDENGDVPESHPSPQEGAMALPCPPAGEDHYGIVKTIWTCPLCTLINSNDKLTCGACSKTKPTDFRIPEENKKTPIQLKQFSVSSLVGNNLNRPSASRAETDKEMNIRSAKDLEKTPISPPTAIKLTEDPGFITKVLGNTNITRNRYRGVDNYNPKNFPKSSSPVRSQIPVRKASPGPKLTAKNPLHLELMKLDNNKDVVENVDAFECPICFGDCRPGNGVVLRDCLHSFCRECLSSTVEHSEEAEIKCPFMDHSYSCEAIMQEREIRAVVTEQLYEKHLMKSIRQAEHKIENAFHCKTPNCRGWCIYEDNVNMFRCPVCVLTNCLTCQAIHDGINCRQYQDQMKSDGETNGDARRTKEMLEAMVADGEAMNCPTCQVIVMKKWGCDWLKCSMCKTEICWVTRGPRWGPAGKGDISEGCKCGVFGTKCHPKCTYCH